MLFWYNIIDLPGVKIPDPLLGRILCLLIPSVDSLFLVADSFEGVYSRHGTLKGPLTRLVRCIGNYKETGINVVLGAEVPASQDTVNNN